MKYQIGDIVHVRDDLKFGYSYGDYKVTYDMLKLAGKDAVITGIHFGGSYVLNNLISKPWFTDEMLSEYQDVQVEVNVEEYL